MVLLLHFCTENAGWIGDSAKNGLFAKIPIMDIPPDQQSVFLMLKILGFLIPVQVT